MRTAVFIATLSLFLIAQQTQAAILLTFEGLQNEEPITNYYTGGLGGLGSGPGEDIGVYFSANAHSLIDTDHGGTGFFEGAPTPKTIMYFSTLDTATMTVAAGFDSGLSFYYTSPFFAGSITIYDGLDGTGNVLAVLDLPNTDSHSVDPADVYSPFVPIEISFGGTARSVDFSGVNGQIGFDNIILGAGVLQNLPEPSILFMSVPITLAALLTRRRRK